MMTPYELKTCRDLIDYDIKTKYFRCHGKLCHTVDQCCREIIDASFTLEEWFFFRRVVDSAMLEASNDRAISSL